MRELLIAVVLVVGASAQSHPVYINTGTSASGPKQIVTSRDFFNVIDFGADPTGGSSSLSAFQSATTAAQAAGGTIYIPAGTYTGVCNWTISTSTYQIAIWGDGQQSEVQCSTARANILNVTGTLGPFIYRVRFDGNTDAYAGVAIYGNASSATITAASCSGGTVTLTVANNTSAGKIINVGPIAWTGYSTPQYAPGVYSVASATSTQITYLTNYGAGGSCTGTSSTGSTASVYWDNANGVANASQYGFVEECTFTGLVIGIDQELGVNWQYLKNICNVNGYSSIVWYALNLQQISNCDASGAIVAFNNFQGSGLAAINDNSASGMQFLTNATIGGWTTALDIYSIAPVPLSQTLVQGNTWEAWLAGGFAIRWAAAPTSGVASLGYIQILGNHMETNCSGGSNTTATLSSSSFNVTVASASGIAVGNIVTSNTYLPYNTLVTGVSGTTITLSAQPTFSGSGVQISFVAPNSTSCNTASIYIGGVSGTPVFGARITNNDTNGQIYIAPNSQYVTVNDNWGTINNSNITTARVYFASNATQFSAARNNDFNQLSGARYFTAASSGNISIQDAAGDPLAAGTNYSNLPGSAQNGSYIWCPNCTVGLCSTSGTGAMMHFTPAGVVCAAY
jgi:hypothetical protein